MSVDPNRTEDFIPALKVHWASSSLAVQLKYLSAAKVHSMFSCSAYPILSSSKGAVCTPRACLGMQTKAQWWGGGEGHCKCMFLVQVKTLM